jgi:hypothetical protein
MTPGYWHGSFSWGGHWVPTARQSFHQRYGISHMPYLLSRRECNKNIWELKEGRATSSMKTNGRRIIPHADHTGTGRYWPSAWASIIPSMTNIQGRALFTDWSCKAKHSMNSMIWPGSFFLGWSYTVSPLGTSASNWPIVPVPDDRWWWMSSSQWSENWQGKQK